MFFPCVSAPLRLCVYIILDSNKGLVANLHIRRRQIILINQ